MINQYIELLTELSNLLHWHLSSSQEAPLTLPWGFVVLTLHSFSLLSTSRGRQENYSRKRPAAVTDSFFASRGSPLTKALTASHVDIHEGTSENEIRAKTEIKLAQQFEHLEEHYKKAGLISLIKIP